jgi:tRNA-uridine aminocarboxypropyltransferase
MKELPAAPPQDRHEPPAAPVDNRVFVLVLQHPQEKREPHATAGLIAASLHHARLAAGLSWPNLAGALGRPADPKRWGVLYLGSARPRTLAAERAILVLDRAGQPLAEPAAILAGLRGIVLLDGSWKEAKTLWWRNPWLLRLHRLVLNPPRPARLGRLRREPRREALSTLEAAALALRHLEAGPQAADALEAALDRLIAAARRPASGERR